MLVMDSIMVDVVGGMKNENTTRGQYLTITPREKIRKE